jgi:hypothetical protein
MPGRGSSCGTTRNGYWPTGGGAGWRALAAASYAADRAVWLVPTMVLGSHWKQCMSTDTAPSCHRHAGSLKRPHSSVGGPKASVSSCFTAAKPSCTLGAVVLPLVVAGYVDAEQLTAEEADACVDHTGKRVVSLRHCVSGSFLGAPAGPASTNPSSAKYRSRSAAPLGHGRRVIRTTRSASARWDPERVGTWLLNNG